jgi:hypothetical protein
MSKGAITAVAVIVVVIVLVGSYIMLNPVESENGDAEQFYDFIDVQSIDGTGSLTFIGNIEYNCINLYLVANASDSYNESEITLFIGNMFPPNIFSYTNFNYYTEGTAGAHIWSASVIICQNITTIEYYFDNNLVKTVRYEFGMPHINYGNHTLYGEFETYNDDYIGIETDAFKLVRDGNMFWFERT